MPRFIKHFENPGYGKMDPITAAGPVLEAYQTYLLLRNLGYKERDSSSLRREILLRVIVELGENQTLWALRTLATCREFSKEKRQIFKGDIDQVRRPVTRKKERRSTRRKPRYFSKKGVGRKRRRSKNKILSGLVR